MTVKKINDWAIPYVKNFRTYIDIGAHDGDTCIDFVDKFKRVYAFEPNPESILKIPNTIKKFPFALGNKREERVLTIPDNGYDNNKHGSIVRHVSGLRQYSVSVRTLDGFEFKEVDLIKINVERKIIMFIGSLKNISNVPITDHSISTKSDVILEVKSPFLFELMKEMSSDNNFLLRSILKS